MCILLFFSALFGAFKIIFCFSVKVILMPGLRMFQNFSLFSHIILFFLTAATIQGKTELGVDITVQSCAQNFFLIGTKCQVNLFD